ncbi:nuclear transport factor 2 family protein [Winogradskyella ursingii]|uniref:nuclear transport factor 2 family protein n=1 Tax=Winogradskyella ursingii TaxID=2686079 RepID=UPI0015C86848|nr:nuclear transport factor 2 family protein [Winogradskyella ursingii]
MNDLIEKFYTSFKNLDAKSMGECYHQNVVFKDPAFGVLRGERAKAMWEMLCESQHGKGFKVIYSNIKANENYGSAYWEAYYTFSKTNRKVFNEIEASFEFRDGLIIKRTDEFCLHKWAKQALGIKGIFFGGMQFFKKKLQRQTNRALDDFIKKRAV